MKVISLIINFKLWEILFIFALAATTSGQHKIYIMESKILIDVNYSTREPQIFIRHAENNIGDDPRDKLIAMLAGQAMPGTNDGYCRIERYPSDSGIKPIVITPLDPFEAVKHIPFIKRLAKENVTRGTTGVPREIEEQDIAAVNAMCVESLPPDAFEKWEQIKELLKQTRQAFKAQ